VGTGSAVDLHPPSARPYRPRRSTRRNPREMSRRSWSIPPKRSPSAIRSQEWGQAERDPHLRSPVLISWGDSE